MCGRVGLLGIVGVFGWLAAADAQAPSLSATATPFDGTYRFASAARVNKTYTTRGGQMGQCPDRKAGPLTIALGQVRYTSATGQQVEGTVGPQGELTMRAISPPASGGYRPVELIVSGTIDDTGTARVRQKGNSCSYDFVWRKQ